MVSNGFQQVYEGVCQILGVAPQALAPDEHGQVGFGMQLGEVPVQVAATTCLAPQAQAVEDGLLLMIEFGPPDTKPARELLEALLDGNLLLGATGGPVFCRNPIDGSLLLLQALPLANLDGERVHGLALQLAGLAQVWRSAACAGPMHTGLGSTAPGQGPTPVYA